MLKNDFYTIISVRRENNFYKIELGINATHAIFEGHFPGQPVVPGACMLQMVKELTETVVDKKLQLIKADSLKFLMLINPYEHTLLQMNLACLKLEDDTVSVAANLSTGTTICFKFTGRFQFYANRVHHPPRPTD